MKETKRASKPKAIGRAAKSSPVDVADRVINGRTEARLSAASLSAGAADGPEGVGREVLSLEEASAPGSNKSPSRDLGSAQATARILDASGVSAPNSSSPQMQSAREAGAAPSILELKREFADLKAALLDRQEERSNLILQHGRARAHLESRIDELGVKLSLLQARCDELLRQENERQVQLDQVLAGQVRTASEILHIQQRVEVISALERQVGGIRKRVETPWYSRLARRLKRDLGSSGSR